MPFIIVQGITSRDYKEVSELKQKIRKAAASIHKLGLKPYDFKIFFSSESVRDGSNSLFAEIRCLFVKPGRTKVVRNALVDAVQAELYGYARENRPNCSLVWVSQQPFDDGTIDEPDKDFTVSVYSHVNPQEVD